MRKFEYCSVSASRDLGARDYPWSAWTKSYGGQSEKLEVPENQSVLNLLGAEGWELLGPPEVTKMTGVVAAFNHSSGQKNHYIDWAQPYAYTYYFKREIER